ncbi:uncharacterized protein LOC136078622 [Hydra vulgaris]|uniref:Uncharacterized protein LOC136078622 n=1 Tax=Hydra vulgaris TaxID=6087 RepID=A0ABM4BN05_HYDVU
MGKPELGIHTAPCAPKPRKSFSELTSRMKYKTWAEFKKISLQYDQTFSSRVFEYLLEDEDNPIKVLAQEERDNIYVICKVGGDGQSDQSEFQNAAPMKRGKDDSTLYSIVFVLLEVRSGKKVIWKNCNPNSPDATRHLMFCFAKETASFIQEKCEHLQNEILSLESIKFTLHENTFVINSSLSTIYTTMNDGKILNAMVSKMLKKNLASQCCHVCQASPKEFILETIWNKDKLVDKNILKLVDKNILNLEFAVFICGYAA